MAFSLPLWVVQLIWYLEKKLILLTVALILFVRIAGKIAFVN